MRSQSCRRAVPSGRFAALSNTSDCDSEPAFKRQCRWESGCSCQFIRPPLEFHHLRCLPFHPNKTLNLQNCNRQHPGESVRATRGHSPHGLTTLRPSSSPVFCAKSSSNASTMVGGASTSAIPTVMRSSGDTGTVVLFGVHGWGGPEFLQTNPPACSPTLLLGRDLSNLLA